ncbi:hypothetical protein UFOVP1382_74 [uncultured Caudovirales phage]|uniref:Uncharacterized protein n=1 Tax=uncultured Caudovirales phage TaxID=2100421 RepID=A0A6J5S3C1_9CAUD|nr:hypothetical protein UFOVP1382_74 [uncultured Caudovirales phage]
MNPDKDKEDILSTLAEKIIARLVPHGSPSRAHKAPALSGETVVSSCDGDWFASLYTTPGTDTFRWVMRSSDVVVEGAAEKVPSRDALAFAAEQVRRAVAKRLGRW